MEYISFSITKPKSGQPLTLFPELIFMESLDLITITIVKIGTATNKEKF